MNMKNFLSSLEVQFSQEEKQSAISTIHQIVKLSRIAKEQGVLALESEISSLDSNIFLKNGISLILDGVHLELVEKILQYSIQSESYKGIDLLNRLLIMEGVLAIQSGLYPRTIIYLLGSVLGENYPDKLLLLFNQSEEIKTLSPDKITSTESIPFTEKLLQLSEADLASLLIGIDYAVLAIAFFRCSTEFIYRMKYGVSKNSFVEICNYIQAIEMVSPEDALESQSSILRRLEYLLSCGEIRATNNE